MSYNIEKLDINDYPKCNAIWDMQADPLTENSAKKLRAETVKFMSAKKTEIL